jgi:hypothetical protein
MRKRLYVSYGTGDRSLTHVVTPVQGKADMFIVRTLPLHLFAFFFFFSSGAGSPHHSTKITLPRYGIWSVIWDSYYKQNQV